MGGTKSFGGVSKRRKLDAASRAVAKAKQLLTNRVRGTPYATRGFGGTYRQFSRTGAVELKFIDTQVTNTQVTTAGAITLINGVAQGTDFTNRIGRKILMKSILQNWMLYPNSSTNMAAGDVVRVMTIYDNQPNSGSTPAVTDVLVTADVNSPLNLNNRDRFQVLLDKRFPMGGAQYSVGSLSTGSPLMRHKSTYKKCLKDVIFSGTGSTLGSIQTGALYYLTISKTNNATTLDSYHRVRFSDS